MALQTCSHKVRYQPVIVVAALLYGGVIGCGEGSVDGAAPTQTVSATRTLTPSPTPTPTKDEETHDELLIGSDADGSGSLKAEFELDEPIALPFSTCVGGTGELCTGGVQVFSIANPGFDTLEDSEPEHSHFVLPDGLAVNLAVESIDPGLTVQLNAVNLTEGSVVRLGEVPFHADPLPSIAIDGGEEPAGEFRFSFHFTAPSYGDSPTYTLTFVPGDEHH